jgi:hypothetical protein
MDDDNRSGPRNLHIVARGSNPQRVQTHEIHGVRPTVPPQHELVGLTGRHKKVPYLSIGISIAMINM